MMKINWGWKIVIAHGVFMAATISWVSFAMTTDVDLVRPDYYKQGLRLDQTMASRGRAHELKGSASISVDRAKKMLVLQLPSDQAASVVGTIKFYCPSSPKQDRTVQLQMSSDGTMHTPTTGLSKGLWHVTADWSFNGKTYQLLSDVTL